MTVGNLIMMKDLYSVDLSILDYLFEPVFSILLKNFDADLRSYSDSILAS